MDNTNYLLEFNIPGCSSGFENFGSSTVRLKGSHVVCFCCLSTKIPVVNASKCNHTEFVKSYFKLQNAAELWICSICHYMLKKIELFRFQVYKSFHNLKRMPQGDRNWKLVNELTKEDLNNISITSIVKTETEDTTDPLEVTNTNEKNEIEIKLEPEFDSDISSEPTNAFEESIQTYTHETNTHRNEPTNDTKQKETSQNLNLMNMIQLTPIRPQKKHNPLLKTMLSTEGPFSIPNYIKILPTPDTVKSQKSNTVVQQKVAVENKLVDTQEKPAKIFVTANEAEVKDKHDKVYSLLHKPSNEIDSTYEGKIMELTITQDQLEKEREEKRNEESFKMAKHKCNTCIKIFEYEFVMDAHNARQHKKADANLETVCLICKCVYSNANYCYRNHFKNHFTRFVCVVCNEYSTDLPKLALHYNQSHPEKEPIPLSYWCKKCDFETDSVQKYRQHTRMHRTQRKHHSAETTTKNILSKPTKSYKCDHCDRTYVLPATLRAHVKTCHSDKTNTYYCEKCDKQFKCESIYKNHLTQSSAHVSIEEVFKYMCDYCGKKTKYKDGMASHIETEHLKTGKYRCQPCNKIYGSENLLQRHINFVHNKRQLPKDKICQYCGKAFATDAVLKTHIRSHTGERPLRCDICEMTFSHKASLYTHRRLKHKIPRKRELIAAENEQ